MALFKFRKGGDEPVAAAPQTESIEAMRRRARHRLIGAGVLVLLGVVGFPLVFDTQPRPIPVDIPIEIPDRNKAKPLAVPAQVPSVAGAVTTASAPAAAPSAAPKAETQVAPAESASPPKAEPAKPEAKPPAAPPPKAEAKPEPKPEAKAEPAKPAKPADDGSRAQALLEGKPVLVSPPPAPAASADTRFIVQVGAFADESKVRETRLKVERTGLKTYTHVAETKDGKLTRVRVGPFASRAEAEKAAEKIKGLDLQIKILTL